MRRSLGALLLVGTITYSCPALAEIRWVDVGGSYRLNGAQLLRLREQLPPELQESLKAVRNIVYPSEAAYRADLTEALLTDEYRVQWLDRLVEAAAGPGAAFGIEPRGGNILTITVSGEDHALDDNPFTSASWLSALPGPSADSTLATDLVDGCLTVSEGNAGLFSLCAPEVGGDGTTVLLRTKAETVRGLGQEFVQEGETEADWIGRVRHGFNVMGGFNGGANGNTLFPIAYFDAEPQPFALILDNRTQQEWDFSGDDFRLRVWGSDFKLHVLTGDTLADIRRQYMALTGTPPIPPKSAFGLWISEYGYESWDELDDKIATLKANGFPLSGVVLDLFWFGGIRSNSADSSMGSLRWDETRFPDPVGKIAALKAEGIDMMLIEESYISANLPEYAALAERGGLAKDESGQPLAVNPAGNWWGKGGMVDWTTAGTRDFWHDFRRQPLIDMGVAGHWTDLGEPEMINPAFVYGDGLVEAEVHNSYNLLWLQGIYDGYRRNSPDKRPFMMSRSGAMAMQRLGAAMWSGDIAGDFGSLAAQMPNQTHMMWSGLDYYGSDVGGFHRSALGVYPGSHDEAMDQLYTQWLAYSAMFEVPIRPHTENLCNCKETAPDRIGDLESNRANLQLRYRLAPYYYSLAYATWRRGDPVFPAVDYWFPEADEARELGHEKMIGSELLSAGVAEFGAEEVEVYLPAGDWYVFRTGAKVISAGETFTFPVWEEGRFQLPLLARDGAVIPVEGGVLNVFGNKDNVFEWYDDDGTSMDYRNGGFDLIRVFVDGDRVLMQRGAGLGLAPKTLRWVRPDFTPVDVVVINGTEVPFTQTNAEVLIDLPTFSDRLVVEVR